MSNWPVCVCVCLCFTHPTVLVFIEQLGRDCCRISHFALHFISNLAAHRNVHQLVLNALTVEDTYYLCLLRFHLQKNITLAPSSTLPFITGLEIANLKKLQNHLKRWLQF